MLPTRQMLIVQIGTALAAARADWPADLKALAFGLQIGSVEPPWSVEACDPGSYCPGAM